MENVEELEKAQLPAPLHQESRLEQTSEEQCSTLKSPETDEEQICKDSALFLDPGNLSFEAEIPQASGVLPEKDCSVEAEYKLLLDRESTGYSSAELDAQLSFVQQFIAEKVSRRRSENEINSEDLESRSLSHKPESTESKDSKYLTQLDNLSKATGETIVRPVSPSDLFPVDQEARRTPDVELSPKRIHSEQKDQGELSVYADSISKGITSADIAEENVSIEDLDSVRFSVVPSSSSQHPESCTKQRTDEVLPASGTDNRLNSGKITGGQLIDEIFRKPVPSSSSQHPESCTKQIIGEVLPASGTDNRLNSGEITGGQLIDEIFRKPGPSRQNDSPKKDGIQVSEESDKYYDARDRFSKEQSSSEDSRETKPVPFYLMSDPSYGAEIVLPEHENGFVKIDYKEKIREKHIIELLKRMRTNHYAATKTEEDLIYGRCKGLYEKDYFCEIVDNSGGALSVNYPVRLLIPVQSKRSEDERSGPFDAEKYKARVKSCHTSRCRTRFVAPVMLWHNKFICRSGTLSVRKSAVYETVTMPKDPSVRVVPTGVLSKAGIATREVARHVAHRTACVMEASHQLLDMGSIERIRIEDGRILKDLNVNYIFDLMVEDRKIVKQVRVSSSEKINKDIYGCFDVEQIPYPGCEFFGRYRKAGRNPQGMIFNWRRPDVNAVLKLTKQKFRIPRMQWKDYKEWDVVELTQNYMALILTYLVKGDSGLLVHCISGWDRTPLFISLIRISLWADGVIHRSLSGMDMVYLTLAYDWYLFGHNLPARLKKGEEIMHFCFKFLPYIADERYSVRSIYRSREKGLEAKHVESERVERINFISKYVLSLYEENIMPQIRQTA